MSETQLHLTKIAYGAQSLEEFFSWFEDSKVLRLTTRNLPRRQDELKGGSLFWIFDHTLVARNPIAGFSRARDGRWHIELACPTIPVTPTAKRAHQGWRYLPAENAPPDLAPDQADAALPPHIVRELGKVGLI